MNLAFAPGSDSESTCTWYLFHVYLILLDTPQGKAIEKALAEVAFFF